MKMILRAFPLPQFQQFPFDSDDNEYMKTLFIDDTFMSLEQLMNFNLYDDSFNRILRLISDYQHRVSEKVGDVVLFVNFEDTELES